LFLGGVGGREKRHRDRETIRRSRLETVGGDDEDWTLGVFCEEIVLGLEVEEIRVDRPLEAKETEILCVDELSLISHHSLEVERKRRIVSND